MRYRVFAQEMGARLPSQLHRLDADEFDAFCDRLLLREPCDGEVIGTYRVLTPEQALAAGGLYGDHEFDLTGLQALRPRLAELGRAFDDACRGMPDRTDDRQPASSDHHVSVTKSS